MEQFILGVATSICATSIIAFFVKYLDPRVRAYIQRTPAIGGKWWLMRTDDEDDKEVLTIKQRGVRVTAVLTHPNAECVFEYKGSFYSGQLVLTFEEKEKEGFAVGAMVFKFLADGQKMVGRSL
jgi:hypothetical protein